MVKVSIYGHGVAVLLKVYACLDNLPRGHLMMGDPAEVVPLAGVHIGR